MKTAILGVMCGLLSLLAIPSLAGEDPMVQIDLAWNNPLENEDGSPIAGLSGYRVHYGVESGVYIGVVETGTIPEARVTGLQRGITYFFSVTTVSTSGAESLFSSELMWTAPPEIADPNDGDGNGLHDDWELAWFGAVGAPGCGSADDCDGDGVPNEREYTAGTNPTDPLSRPWLSINEWDGSMLVAFVMLTVSGSGYTPDQTRIYSVERCSDPKNNDWQTVPGLERLVTSRQRILSFPVEGSPSSSFFRLHVRLEE